MSCTVAQSLLYLVRAFTFLLNKTLHWFAIRAQLFNSFQQGDRNLGIPGHDNRDSYRIAPSLFIEGFSQTPVSPSFVSFLNPSELHLGQRSMQDRPTTSTVYRLRLQTKSKCALTIQNIKCSFPPPSSNRSCLDRMCKPKEEVHTEFMIINSLKRGVEH